MKEYQLSIILPARNEEFLKQTIDDILLHKEEDTEIIVGLDGVWAKPQIPQHPDVTVVFAGESIGQRSITRLCAGISKAKYIIKVDAHCKFDQGFDRLLIEAFRKVGDNTVMVPIMKNLHIYDWKCHTCGKRVYQDVKPLCPKCATPMQKKMVWEERRGTRSFAYRFDSEPHFQYWNEYTKHPDYIKDLKEQSMTRTMSLQGSFFMCARERYFALDVDDESFGSWGNQGMSVACKFWLSGGQVLVLHTTWYAHCFRTKGDVFGFPYPQDPRVVQTTKRKIKDLFYTKSFSGQIHPLSWLIEKFSPVPGWTETDIINLKKQETFK